MSRRHTIAEVSVVTAAVGLSACAAGSERDNLDLVSRFPTIDGVQATSTESHGYCDGDTCLLGDDGIGTLVIYDIDAHVEIDDIVDDYAEAFDGWQLERERMCISRADVGAECEEEVLVARPSDGTGRIALNFDNWPRRFEAYVDAHAD